MSRFLISHPTPLAALGSLHKHGRYMGRGLNRESLLPAKHPSLEGIVEDGERDVRLGFNILPSFVLKATWLVQLLAPGAVFPICWKSFTVYIYLCPKTLDEVVGFFSLLGGSSYLKY